MIGEIFAYLYGRSVGREQGRRTQIKRKPLTHDEAGQHALASLVILCCLGIVIVFALFGGVTH